MAIDYGIPDAPFQRELNQLGDDAARTAAALAEANRLPDEFPIEAMIELCHTLAGLRHGTGRNAGVQLEIARAMLPRVRREHFFPEDLIDPEDEDDVRLIRGMSLDRSIATLHTSVATALDEYRHQLQIEHDDRVGIEEEGVLPKGEFTASLNDAASAIIDRANTLDQEFAAHDLGQTPNGEILRRRVQDSANLTWIARAQLHTRPIVKRWWDATGTALRSIPGLISTAGDSIKVGADVAEEFADWWSRTRGVLRKGFFNQLRDLGETITRVGQRLDRQTASAPNEAKRQRDPDIVAAEAEVRRMLLAGETPPRDLAAKVQILDLHGVKGAPNNIRHPADLQLLAGLIELNAQRTSLVASAIGVHLALLRNLRRLAIQEHSRDISALGALTNLTSLSVQASQAGDISALGALTNLTSLSFTANQARDISALGALTNLTSLSVQASQAGDISALGALTNLTSLSFTANQARDISALGALTNLTSLSVTANQASDISALGALTNLTSLSVTANQASDISALGALTNLTSLTVQASQIDLIQIGGLPRLEVLKIDSKGLANLGGIGRIPELREILIANAAVPIDLRPLEACPKLERIRISGTKISDYGTLRDLIVGKNTA